MQIIPLSEGKFTIDKSKQFIPFDDTQHRLHDRPQGSLLVEVQPFVILTAADVILLDTGLGYETGGIMQLHWNLAAAGIQPDTVSKVLLSHLHKDHAGGVSTGTGLSNRQLAFPQANYYVQRSELAHAFEKGMPSYAPDELECLRTEDRVQLLDGDGSINGYIEYAMTGAHSPYHQVFWIREGDDTVFFGADDAPQLQQMKHRFVAKYDFDGRKAMALRQQWWQQGREENWTFLFFHDVKNPVWNFK